MPKTKAQIIAEAQVVKNATEVGENTATRVGGVLEDLADADSVVIIPVTGTSSGGNITLSSNPFTQVQTAVNAGQHVVVRVTIASDIIDFTMNTYSASVATYIGMANFLENEFQLLCSASSAVITNRSTSNTFSTGESVPNVGIDATPTQNSHNLVESGGVYGAIDIIEDDITILNDKVDILEEDVNNVMSVNVEDNSSVSSGNWSVYTVSSNSRGRYTLSLLTQDYDSYVVTMYVAENSPIKCGCAILISGTTNYAYDSSWITAGNSISFTNAKDVNNNGTAIVFNTTYVNDTTSATTYEEFVQYVSFSIFFCTKNGIDSQLVQLKKKCHLTTSSNSKMVAHRGFHLSSVPENSIDAYRWAGLMGYDIAETDFCPTSDNQLVLMHDASINRTMRNVSDYSTISGTVNVNSKTLAELRSNYVLASEDVRYRRPIPTLEEYFICCRESGLFALPEIKSTGTTQTNVLAAYNMGMELMGADRFGFCSFNYALLDYARTLNEKIPLWYIGNSILGTNNSITGESRETPYTIWYPSYNGYSASASLFKQYKAKGMQVAVWTVPVNEYDNMLKMGADYIAADYCGANTEKTDGNVYSEANIITNGTRTNEGIILTSGQIAQFIETDECNMGIYYLSVVAQGKYVIKAPNLTISLDDSAYTRHIFQGLIINALPLITFIATASASIQFANIKIVRIQ